MAKIDFIFVGQNQQLLQSIEQSKTAMNQLNSAASAAGVSIDQALGRIKGNAIALAGVAGIATGGVSLIHKIVGTRSEFQNTEAMFKVFLKDGEKATSFMKEIQTYSFNNVFDFGSLTKQAAQLMAYGTEQEKVIDKLDRLSEIAAGTGGTEADLAALVNAYNRVKATDVMDSRMEQSLAAKGIRVKEILGMAETDKVHFEDLDKALVKVTSEGGMYFGMMQEKMKTLGDSVGLLQDRVMQMFNDMGKDIQEPLRNIIYNVADLVENWRDFVPEEMLQGAVELMSRLSDHMKEILSIVEKIAVTWGVYKASMAMGNAFNNAKTLAALNEEREALLAVRDSAVEAQKELLKMDIKSLGEKQEATGLSGEEEIELLRKKQELNEIELAQNNEKLVAQGKMSQARAEEIGQVHAQIDAEVLRLTTMREEIKEQLKGNEAAIALSKKKIEGYEEEVKELQKLLEKQREVNTAKYTKKGENKEKELLGELTQQQTRLERTRRELGQQNEEHGDLTNRKGVIDKALEKVAVEENTAAIEAENKVKKIGNAITKIATLEIKKLSASLKAMWASNPIGMIMTAVSGIISLVKWLKELHDNQPDVKAANDYKEFAEEATNASNRQIIALDRLIGKMKAYDENSNEYKSAQQEIINNYKQYLPEMDKETTTVENLSKWYAQLTDNITRATKAREATTKYKDVENSLIETQAEQWGEIESMLEEEYGATQGQIYLKAFKDAVSGNEEEIVKAGGDMKFVIRDLIPNYKELGLDTTSHMWFKVTKQILKNTRETLPALQELKKLQEDINNGEGASTEVKPENVAQGKNLTTIIAEIKAKEEEIKELRKKYAESGTKEAGDALKSALEDQQSLSEAYSKMTGKSWEDAVKLEESNLEELQKLANERVKIKESEIKEARAKRKADYDQQIEEINQAEKKWNKNHKGQEGAKADIFNKQRENAALQLELDTKKMDEQFSEWKRNAEQERMQLQFDIDMQKLQNDLENATTYAEKATARKAIREKENENITKENTTERDKELLSKLGGDRATLDNFLAGDITGIDTETLNELYDIIDAYNELLKLKQSQRSVDRNQEDFKTDIEDYQEYANELIEIEQWKQGELEKLYKGESDKSIAEIDDIAEGMAKRALSNHDIDQYEGQLTGFITTFIDDINNATAAEIEQALATFNEECKKQIDAIMADTTLTDEQKKTKVQQIKNAQIQMQKKTDDAKKNAKGKYAKDEKEVARLNRKLEVTVKTLELVRDAADSVAEVFGGSLSKSGKKALSSISNIASTSMGAINSIYSLVQSSSQGLWKTAEVGTKAMQQLERASFILTVLSVAVQVITKLVEVFKQFTTEAKLQDAIDDQKKYVESLERSHTKLENLYRNSVGLEYYRGLSAQAADYNQIIAANNSALEEANRLYDLQVKKHGENSDKAEEALEQVQELEDKSEELKQAQEDMYKQLAEELMTTDVTSFAENLADSMVSAFEDGTQSIESIWDDTLKDLQKSMMTKALSTALTSMFQPIFDRISQKTKDGTFTMSEIDQAMAEIDAVSGQAQGLIDYWRQAMEERGVLGDGSVEGSTGGFQTMSQDTADALEARFTALQMEGANVVAQNAQLQGMFTQQFGIMNNYFMQLINNNTVAIQQAENNLDQLKIIADNTAMLAETNRRLNAIEKNTDRL